MAGNSSNNEELKESISRFEILKSELIENKLINKDSKKLDLTVFNKNLESASKNLGTIIPSIIEVSKEQVALVNNGLEGTMNFIKSFQTFNTAFAVFTELPSNEKKNILKNYNMTDLETLETKIITEVQSNLKGLDEMLKETFKEVSVYYTALGNIIYSESEGGTIAFEYKRSTALKEKMGKIYTRKDEAPKEGFRMYKSLGLVQIIDSLVDVAKKAEQIPDIKDKEKLRSYITAEKGGKESQKEVKIEIDIDIISALKGISNELLSSLKGAGVLIENESNHVNEIRAVAFDQEKVAEGALSVVNEILKKLDEHKKVTTFFINSGKDLDKLKNINVKETEEAKKFEEIAKIEKEQGNALKAHDEIIKHQMKLIIEVVNAFSKIINLWSHQVDNEISISQVADKAVIAIDKLSKVEKKAGIDAEPLLVAAKTQKEIDRVCSYAKELKNVGKIMQMLLQRVKSLLNYNQGLESQIRLWHSGNEEAEKYKNEKTAEIMKLVHEQYPKVSKSASKTIAEFSEKIKVLSQSKNRNENKLFFNNIIEHYKKINSNTLSNLKEIRKQTEAVDVDIRVFPESCEKLGELLNHSEDEAGKIFSSFTGLRKTFEDDFGVYTKLSDDYRELIKGIAPFLDLINYIISLEKKLASQKIDLKTLNLSLKAFIVLFDKIKKMQEEGNKLDTELINMMKEVKLTGKDYYGEYKEMLKVGKVDMLEQLEKEVKKYFESTKEKTEEAYKYANEWINTFEHKFTSYQGELKNLNIGFFEKLFKTQSYKEKDFWQELKEVKGSFATIDKQINILKGKNLELPKDVPGFCKFSVSFVNEMLKGYSDLIIEVARILGIMETVNENLSKLQGKELNSYKEMLETVKIYNDKLQEFEKKTVELKELDPVNVDELLKVLNGLTDFSSLSSEDKKNLAEISKLKTVILNSIETLRNELLVFYTTYLIKELPEGKEKDEYRAIRSKAEAKTKQ